MKLEVRQPKQILEQIYMEIQKKKRPSNILLLDSLKETKAYSRTQHRDRTRNKYPFRTKTYFRKK